MKLPSIQTMLAVVACLGILGCKPDLKVSLTANSAYDQGENAAGTVSITVENAGSGRAAGSDGAGADGYFVDLVLSQDNSVPVEFAVVPSPYTFQEDMLLQGGRVSNTQTLAGGASVIYEGHGGPIPPGTPSPVFLCAVVDPGLKVSESDEGNNTYCEEIAVTVSQACVTFETPAPGTRWGNPTGHAPGTVVLTEAGISVRVENFRWPTGGTFNVADVRATTPDFGIDSQFAWTNNISLDFDFTGLAFTPTRVTFEFQHLGGFENLAIDGAPAPVYVGALTAAPSPLGGVSFATSPPVAVAGGYKSSATLQGGVQRLVVGGQEFAVDQICAYR
jgi:hypothetical protein